MLAAENGQPVPADLAPDPLPRDRVAPLGDCDYWSPSGARSLCPMGDLDGDEDDGAGR